jgi:hypothetical protein
MAGPAMMLVRPRTQTCQQSASNKASQHRSLHRFASTPSFC